MPRYEVDYLSHLAMPGINSDEELSERQQLDLVSEQLLEALDAVQGAEAEKARALGRVAEVENERDALAFELSRLKNDLANRRSLSGGFQSVERSARRVRRVTKRLVLGRS